MLQTPPPNKEAGPSRLLKKRVGKAQQVAAVEADWKQTLTSEANSAWTESIWKGQQLPENQRQHQRPVPQKTCKPEKHLCKREEASSQQGYRGRPRAMGEAAESFWLQAWEVLCYRHQSCRGDSQAHCGSHQEDGQEVQLVDRTIDPLEKENLSKEQAKEFRTKLCQRYPWKKETLQKQQQPLRKGIQPWWKYTFGKGFRQEVDVKTFEKRLAKGTSLKKGFTSKNDEKTFEKGFARENLWKRVYIGTWWENLWERGFKGKDSNNICERVCTDQTEKSSFVSKICAADSGGMKVCESMFCFRENLTVKGCMSTCLVVLGDV